MNNEGQGRFCDPAAVQGLTCSKEPVVCLEFRQCGGRSLYAHPAFLAAWSGVLHSVLEDATVDPAQQQLLPPGCTPHITIPLEDTDTAAWEDALSLMHPSRQLFQMDWDSAARLLLLAHKYDMPAVTAHVEAFLMGEVILPGPLHNTTSTTTTTSSSSSSPAVSPASATSSSSSSTLPCITTRLAAHLTPDLSTEWLQLTSLCGLDHQADVCIDYMVQNQVPVNISLLTSLQPQHANQLLAGLMQQLQLVSDKVEKQEQLLSSAVLPIRSSSTRRARCPECKAPWYKLPQDGRSTPYCLNCGKRRPIILGELYQ